MSVKDTSSRAVITTFWMFKVIVSLYSDHKLLSDSSVSHLFVLRTMENTTHAVTHLYKIANPWCRMSVMWEMTGSSFSPNDLWLCCWKSWTARLKKNPRLQGTALITAHDLEKGKEGTGEIPRVWCLCTWSSSGGGADVIIGIRT